MIRPWFLGAASLAAARSIGLLRSTNAFGHHLEANTITNASSAVELYSTTAPFDGPKVIPVNDTTWDWWYFDVVSKDASQSITVAFYSASRKALPFLPQLDSINFVHVSGVFPNGTQYVAILPAQDSPVFTIENGSSGYWEGTGMSWKGSPSLDEYFVNAVDVGTGYSGTMKMKSIAPAHYPCGPATSGQSEEVVPGVGWANSIPDSEAQVNFQIGDYKMEFDGYGYHDKNWGSRSFYESVGLWYWGHARLGEYSIVWFDTLIPDASEYLSAYVIKNGKILTSSCSGIQVRPVGSNSTFPPVLSTGSPTGYSMEIDIPNEGKLVAELSNLAIATTIGQQYTRFIGNISGSIDGVSLPTGSGLWEQFKTKESWN